MTAAITHATGTVPAEKQALRVFYLANTPETDQPELARLANDLLAQHHPWAVDLLRFIGASLLVGPSHFSIAVPDHMTGSMLSVVIDELSPLLDVTDNGHVAEPTEVRH